MSLFGSIRMAGNSLRANDIALQVVGQNIANANTPGYIREDLVLKPAPTLKLGGLLLGTGVDVEAVVQKVDKYLQERLRGAVSENANAQTLQNTYSQLEGVIGALGDNNLSTLLNNFFNSISDILNQPESASVRNLTVLQGQTLTDNIQQLYQRVEDLRSELDGRVQNMAAEINRLTGTISSLNVKIAESEGGGISKSDAVGLRDQRSTALEDLAKLLDIRSIEQPDGTVNVYSGGNYLVYAGTSRAVEAVLDINNGQTKTEIHIADSDAKIDPGSGQLRGLTDARDNILGGFIDQLNDLSKTLAFEFNKVYSSGQGLSGYTTLTGAFNVDDATKALNAAGLPFVPNNGSFQVLVRNKNTGITQTKNILVDLDGTGHDTTLNDLKTALEGIDGLTAEITASGQLKIDSQSSDNEFSFAHDTSGVLAALGLNIFFTGTSARDLNVSTVVKSDPGKFAASSGGIGADMDNAEIMAQFIDQPIASHNAESLGTLYSSMVDEVAQGSATAQATAAGSQSFETSLRGQATSISGVNLDEEAVRMIAYQRAYQASARFISAIADLFDILVKI